MHWERVPSKHIVQGRTNCPSQPPHPRSSSPSVLASFLSLSSFLLTQYSFSLPSLSSPPPLLIFTQGWAHTVVHQDTAVRLRYALPWELGAILAGQGGPPLLMAQAYTDQLWGRECSHIPRGVGNAWEDMYWLLYPHKVSYMYIIHIIYMYTV